MQNYPTLLFLILLGLIGSTQHVQAQKKVAEIDSLPTLRPVLRLNLVGIGVGLEAPASPRLSVYIEAGASFYLHEFTDIQGQPDSRIMGIPYATMQVRYYYNIARRQRLGKQVSYQSGNFLGIAAPYISATPNTSMLTGLGPVWGHQRQLGDAGFSGFVIGAGFYLPDSDGGGGATPQIRLNLNTWLGVGFAF